MDDARSTVSTRSVACVLAPRFRARLELARRPELAHRAGLIVDRSGQRPLVIDCWPETAALSAGMTLEQALSIEPDAVALDADEPHYQREFERLLDALDDVSDRVEGVESAGSADSAERDGELGVAYVGLDGLAEMYGGERALLDALCAAPPDHLAVRIGVAAGKFPAFVAAHTCRAPGLTSAPRDTAAFLAPHPIDLLPASIAPPDLIDDLRRLGLQRLGDLAAQDMHALLDRFGHDGRRAWELARGIDQRPLQARRPQTSISETVTLPTASVSLELLRIAVDTLCTRVFADPQMQGRYAGSATLSCTLEDAPSPAHSSTSGWERRIHFKTAVGGWRRAAEIIKSRLEHDYPTAPVESMTLTLAQLSGASGVQLSLFPDIRADRERRLLAVERQLQARLNGTRALHRLVDVAPWHPAPELRTLRVSIDPAAADSMQPLTSPNAVEVVEGPDQAPQAVRIANRWRQVASIEDHWSFDLWWRPTPINRAYYRINQEDGQQCTIYRDQSANRWYQQTA